MKKEVATDTPVDLEIWKLIICHLWHNSNARWECSRLGEKEVNVKD